MCLWRDPLLSNGSQAGVLVTSSHPNRLSVGAQAFLARCPLSFSALATKRVLQLTGVHRSTAQLAPGSIFHCLYDVTSEEGLDTSLADTDNNHGICAQGAACLFPQNCWHCAWGLADSAWCCLVYTSLPRPDLSARSQVSPRRC